MGNERISNDVQQRVNVIKQMEGNKKKIDSDSEFQALQQLSQELANTGNRFEKEHIQGLMVEYETAKADEAEKAEAKKQKNAVSDAARKDLANIKKMVPDKNDLNEAEARMVLELIKNTRGDYNAAEIEYFKQELIKAGFADLLKELEGNGAKTEQTPAAEKTEEPVEGKNADTPKEPEAGATEPKDNYNKPPKGKDYNPDFDPRSSKPRTDFPKNRSNPGGVGKPVQTEKPVDTKKPAQTAKPLTQKEILEAQNAGYQVSRALNGYTTDSEQALIVDYTTHRLTPKNFAEFMKGYKTGGADAFFSQVASESGFKDKNSIILATASKMLSYINANPDVGSKKQLQIIQGIIAEGNFDKNNCKKLDNILASLQ